MFLNEKYREMERSSYPMSKIFCPRAVMILSMALLGPGETQEVRISEGIYLPVPEGYEAPLHLDE
jgi:hypothetical protein